MSVIQILLGEGEKEKKKEIKKEREKGQLSE